MIEPLFTLIPNYPGSYIAIIEDENFDCVDRLAKYAKTIDATLHVKSISNKNYDKALQVDKFSLEQKRYNTHAVQYDFIFLCANVQSREDLEQIANKLYRVMKNAGHLFLLYEKKSEENLTTILQKSNFVALNTITLSDTYDIISAKKMHGWMKV